MRVEVTGQVNGKDAGKKVEAADMNDLEKKDADVADPVMPEWLRDLIETHLSERDDINEIVQNAAADRGPDPDDWRDRRDDP